MLYFKREMRISCQVLREDKDWVVSMQKNQESATKWTEEKAKRAAFELEKKNKKNEKHSPKAKVEKALP